MRARWAVVVGVILGVLGLSLAVSPHPPPLVRH